MNHVYMTLIHIIQSGAKQKISIFLKNKIDIW